MVKLLLSFRKINSEEKEIIKEILTDISDKICDFILREKFIIYYSTINQNLFLVPDVLAKDLEHISKDYKIGTTGVLLGFFSKNRLYLSLQAAELFYKSEVLDFRSFLVLNEKGEKSSLYGNPIKKGMLINFSPEIRKNKLVFLLNNDKELLGIGFSKINLEEFKKLKFKDVIALNLVDKGSYLRREK